MANIEKPDMSVIWAEDGARVSPTEGKIKEGWVVEPPPHQWENWSQWRQDEAIAHIFQRGIPLWDDKTHYHANNLTSYVLGKDGKIYNSLAASGGDGGVPKDPTVPSNTSYWKVSFTTSDEAIPQSRVTNLTRDLNLKADKTYVDSGLNTKLSKSENLNDVTNKTIARSNLGLGSAATSSVVQTTGSSTTNVMSQKAVTDNLNTKADKTVSISAGTGLSGGGDLSASRSLSVKYGVLAGTAAQGDDIRLSNSREWTAGTVSQAEAEAGTAATRRAWTAQRVRQAIVAWFNGVSGTIGRTILGRNTAIQVRGDLGLGTAATRDVGTNAGQVMEVGAGTTWGPSYDSFVLPSGADDIGGANLFYRDNMKSHGALGINVTHSAYPNYNWQIAAKGYTDPTPIFRSQGGGGVWGASVEGITTGNILTTTGQSTLFPMTQKAVTDALNTKANTSTQVIAGTGLTGGGNLAANRTLNVSYGTAAGTSAQGNDSRINNGQTAFSWGNHASAGYVPNARTITAGTGLSGGGTLGANRTLSVKYGTAAGTAAQGNDSRITGAAQKSANLSDLSSASAARQHLGLGTAATRDVSQSIGGSESLVMSQNATTNFMFGANQGNSYKSDRKLGVTYTNTNDVPVMVTVTCSLGPKQGVSLFVEGNGVSYVSNVAESGNTNFSNQVLVAAGETYMANSDGALVDWWEFTR